MINKILYKTYINSKKFFQTIFFWRIRKVKINSAENILFFFHWGLGDFLILSEFVEIYIKNNKSKKFYTTASKNNYQYLLDSNLFNDVILIDPPWTSKKGKYNILRNLFFFKKIKSNLKIKEFNLILSLRNDPRDLFLAKFLKPNTIVSSSYYGIKESIDIDIKLSEDENKYNWNNKLLNFFNLEKPNNLQISQLKQSNLYDIFIHTGSNDSSKNLPNYKLIELLNLIDLKKNKTIIYTSESNLKILSDFKHIKLKDYSKTSLHELEQDISESQNVIVNDSGPMHLASKLGKDSVSVWGSTTFEYWKPKNTIPISVEISCRPCKYNCIYDSYKCLDMIDVKDILKNLKLK